MNPELVDQYGDVRIVDQIIDSVAFNLTVNSKEKKWGAGPR
ncbi:MAG: hypothetical protein VX929_05680 [Pseudomonadota bacterium]|nr:hypothetical protein [Pseudomonadota bacterium]